MNEMMITIYDWLLSRDRTAASFIKIKWLAPTNKDIKAFFRRFRI